MAFSVGIHPPKTPITEGSGGVAKNTLPNVCKMPGPPAPFVPTPLPNIGKSELSPKDYSKTVKIEGKNVAIRGATFESMGDIASKGTGGGLISANTHGPTKFITPGSMTVKIEGKNVHLLGEPMLNNCGPSGSPPNTGATMAGVKNPRQNMPPCPPHQNPYVQERDRNDETSKAYDQVIEKENAEADAKKALNKAMGDFFSPPKGARSSTIQQQVKISVARAEKARGDVDAAKDKLKAQRAEQKVSDDEGGGKNILIKCGVCNTELAEIDVLTSKGKAKEVKQSEGAFSAKKFQDKITWLSHPAVAAVLGPVTAEVAIVNPNSGQICKNLEANNPQLAGRTQSH